MTRRRLALLLTAAVTAPLLATTACSHSPGSDDTAPAAGSSATPGDQLPRMAKKVEDAQKAMASADANGDADNSGN
ncbi:hypothetical protein [Streptomyces sp. NPDC086787]|uniref:hypothetical protein n=1 Tax=Streptomyces sp. NPDC086787 TaxID=3365759 RepID=UPI00382C4D15